MRSRRLALALVFALVAGPSLAQQVTSKDLTSTTCSGSSGSGCVVQNVGNLTSSAIQLTGTWVATIQFEGSVDGTNYQALLAKASETGTGVTSATANGIWGVPVSGLRYVRVRASAYTSGTVHVVISTPSVGGPSIGSN